MPSEALGLLECKGLVSLMEGTDAMLKAANVEMIGWD
jgi:microcompartment protein CcmL/EutN